jgi:hypothetical protein
LSAVTHWSVVWRRLRRFRCVFRSRSLCRSLSWYSQSTLTPSPIATTSYFSRDSCNIPLFYRACRTGLCSRYFPEMAHRLVLLCRRLGAQASASSPAKARQGFLQLEYMVFATIYEISLPIQPIMTLNIHKFFGIPFWRVATRRVDALCSVWF